MFPSFATSPVSPNILFAEVGHYGVLLLDRPDALNALTPPMIAAITVALLDWRDRDDIHGVIIRAKPGAKAFCAGGDVRLACQMAQAKNPDVYDFFRAEYRLNDLIHHYPKPVISLVDGIVMGGGAGIAMHSAVRIVTERALFAMPETAIGFVPDVGSSYFLNQCPKPFGLYLALTGDRIGAGDLCASGLATNFIPLRFLEDLFIEILSSDINDINSIIDKKQHVAPTPTLMSSMANWSPCFEQETISAILTACAASDSANHAFNLLKNRCPTSLAVTFQLMQDMTDQHVRTCLEKEFKIISILLNRNDFYEGVRAVLIDKTHDPVWAPADLSTINMTEIRAIMDGANIPGLAFL